MACRCPTSTRKPMSALSELSDSSTLPSRTSIPKDIVRKATASAASAPAARAAFTSCSARSVSGVRSSGDEDEEETRIGWLSYECDRHALNRRKGQFGQRRQHLVNHALQRHVNHSSQRTRRYFRLTQNIKRIRTPFCHLRRATRHKSRARESFEASNAKWRMRRVGPRPAARPFWLARAFFGERCSCRRAGARCRASSRARSATAFATRHAHGIEYARRRL